ncbi:MAG: cytoskeleton protein RodZ [Candidatus Endobugula sp.]|jgi:cytoskeleton protein RodZ
MNSHDSVASLSDKNRLTAGQVLAERREKLGLTIEECAETLKLSVSKMKALEADNDVPFSSEIFLRGYLKNYAKLVDLPANDVLYYYDSQRQAHSIHAENAMLEESNKSNKKWWLPYILAALIVLTWFIVSNDIKLESYWQLGQQFEVGESLGQEDTLLPTIDSAGLDASLSLGMSSSSGIENESLLFDDASIVTKKEAVELLKLESQIQIKQQDLSPSSVIDGNTPIIDVPVSDTNIKKIEGQGAEVLPSTILESQVDSQAATTSADINQLAEDSDLSLPKALTSEASLVNDLLYFTFLEACWVEVVDATNKTIVSSIRKANSELFVEGRSPFSVVLGNINGATLRLNDKPVDLASSADGRTLRLTVGG